MASPSGDGSDSSSDGSEKSNRSSLSTPRRRSSKPRDYSDPFYIHPNENPSLVLVTPVLDGSNYHCWIQAMTMALEMKNKFAFVDGSILRPDTSDPKFALWKRCNMLTLSWINHSVSTEISSSILWITDAYNVWKELRNRFSQGDNTRISHLHFDIFSLKQGETSVTSYFTKMRILWDELCNYRPIPLCLASPGSTCCNVVKTVNDYRDRDAVMSFLQGLNDNFAAVRSQILLMEPLPSLAKTYAMILQQERQIGAPVTPDISIAAVQTSHFPSAGRGRGKPFPGRGNRLCTHCNRTNHTVDTCWKKHGYPPGYKNNMKSVSNVSVAESSAPTQPAPSPVHITADQLQSLLSLLPATPPTATASANMVSVNNVHSAPSGNSSITWLVTWLVDSGATDHICCCLEFFSSYYAIKPLLITLPSGDTRYTHYKGTIHLTPTITLYDVYYVSDFNSNIISVGQLADTINCRTMFDGDSAILQDIPS